MRVISGELREGSYYLTVEADAGRFRSIHDGHFLGVSRRISVPGFRAGKAPMNTFFAYLRSSGRLEPEMGRVIRKVVDDAVHQIHLDSGEWSAKVFGQPLSTTINELEPGTWKLVFEAMFEPVPGVTLADYGEILTWWQPLEFDSGNLYFRRQQAAEDGNLVFASILSRNANGEIDPRHSVECLPVILGKSKLPGEILDALLGLRAAETRELKWGDYDLKIQVLEVRVRSEFTPEIAEEFGLPAEADKALVVLRENAEQTNHIMRQREIIRWLISPINRVEPMPVHNIRSEAMRVIDGLRSRGRRVPHLDHLILENVKNLKISLILREIFSRENMTLTPEDKAEFLRDVDEKPWLYGERNSEYFFSLDDRAMEEYVLQFKVLNFLSPRFIFSN